MISKYFAGAMHACPHYMLTEISAVSDDISCNNGDASSKVTVEKNRSKS